MGERPRNVRNKPVAGKDGRRARDPSKTMRPASGFQWWCARALLHSVGITLATARVHPWYSLAIRTPARSAGPGILLLAVRKQASFRPKAKTPAACRQPGFSSRAEREGFEPSIRGQPAYSLSRRAPSATRAPLRLKWHQCRREGLVSGVSCRLGESSDRACRARLHPCLRSYLHHFLFLVVHEGANLFGVFVRHGLQLLFGLVAHVLWKLL